MRAFSSISTMNINRCSAAHRAAGQPSIHAQAHSSNPRSLAKATGKPLPSTTGTLPMNGPGAICHAVSCALANAADIAQRCCARSLTDTDAATRENPCRAFRPAHADAGIAALRQPAQARWAEIAHAVGECLQTGRRRAAPSSAEQQLPPGSNLGADLFFIHCIQSPIWRVVPVAAHRVAWFSPHFSSGEFP